MSKFNFNEVLKKVDTTKRELPKKLANMTQNYFVLSWKKQGFDNKDWKEVQRRIPGTPEFKYPATKGLSRRTKPILVQSGELRRRVANSVVVADWDKIRLVVDLPYAEALNEGTNFRQSKAGKSEKRIAQQKSDWDGARRFIGQTKELTQMQIAKIDEYFNKIW